jgi:hypothetical protein
VVPQTRHGVLVVGIISNRSVKAAYKARRGGSRCCQNNGYHHRASSTIIRQMKLLCNKDGARTERLFDLGIELKVVAWVGLSEEVSDARKE